MPCTEDKKNILPKYLTQGLLKPHRFVPPSDTQHVHRHSKGSDEKAHPNLFQIWLGSFFCYQVQYSELILKITSSGRTQSGRKTRKVQMRRKRTGMPRLTLENSSVIPSFRPQNDNWDAQAQPGKLMSDPLFQHDAHISQIKYIPKPHPPSHTISRFLHHNNVTTPDWPWKVGTCIAQVKKAKNSNLV